MSKLVCGVGINDGKYLATVGGRIVLEYGLWKGLLHRCYSELYHRKRPTYIGCSVSENFKSYSYFFDWCQSQLGFGQEGYQLDKDLLLKGNQTYSEGLCVFVPSELNVLLINLKNIRGRFPIGVCYHQGKYQAQINLFGKRQHLGYFNTPELAFQAYKTAKETYIKQVAELYKDQVDIRVYAALMAYQVEITD